MRTKKHYTKVCKGIKYCENDGTYEVQFSKRDPITRQSRNLRRYRDYDGYPITSLEMAKTVYLLLKRELDEKLRNGGVPLWAKCVEEMIKNMKLGGKSQETVTNYESALRKHTFDRWKYKKITQVDGPDIWELFEDHKGVWTPHTAKGIKKYVNAVFNFGIKKRWLHFNPMPEIKISIPTKFPRILTRPEVKKLLREAFSRKWDLAPHAYLAVKWGVRRGELDCLKWNDIDFATNIITIRGSRTRSGVEKETKGNSDRVLPLTKGVKEFLLRLRIETGATGYVVPKVKPWVKHEQARELKALCRDLDLPEVNWHSLRKSWTSFLFQEGLSVSQVMKLGGWKQLKTVLYYLSLSGTDVQDSLDVLEDINFHENDAEIISPNFTNRTLVSNAQKE